MDRMVSAWTLEEDMLWGRFLGLVSIQKDLRPSLSAPQKGPLLAGEIVDYILRGIHRPAKFRNKGVY